MYFTPFLHTYISGSEDTDAEYVLNLPAYAWLQRAKYLWSLRLHTRQPRIPLTPISVDLSLAFVYPGLVQGLTIRRRSQTVE